MCVCVCVCVCIEGVSQVYGWVDYSKCVCVMNLEHENKNLWGEILLGTTLQITLKIQTVHIFFLSSFF